MKVNFKKISIRNFLSFGNNETIFEYKPGINVVTGTIEGSTKRNGVGKSALLIDSLNFVLFGKPSRSVYHINKVNLINDVNKKNCEVHLDFSIGNEIYKIKRSIKPNFLIVEENGKEIQFDSMKNTQKWIEDKLGITQTTFSNIIALNINTSKPFLALDLNEKRKIVEDILSLNIYSLLAESFKEKVLDSKSKISILFNDLSNKIKEKQSNEQNLERILKNISEFEAEKIKNCQMIEENLRKIKEEMTLYESKYKNSDTLSKELQLLKQKLSDVQQKILLLEKEESKVKINIKNLEEAIHTLEHNEYCPVCKSHIKSNVYTQEFLNSCKEKLHLELEKHHKIEEKKKNGLSYKNELQSKINDLENEIKNNDIIKQKITLCRQKYESKLIELNNEKNKQINFDISFLQQKIDVVNNEIEKIQKDLNEQNILFESSKFIRDILSNEEGVKKYIFSKIVPILNKKINDYLKILGADYTLLFNDKFEEIIYTSIGTERTYENFSSGEKKKIDLAVLLALTDIIKYYNSFDCNILVLDEVVDTSLDTESVNSLFYFLKNNYIKRFKDKSVYVITHKNEINPDMYDHLIELKKSHNFTYIINNTSTT